MGDGFQFLDIILFAAIAAFLVFRLRSVLGKRDGHEAGREFDPFKQSEDKAGKAKRIRLSISPRPGARTPKRRRLAAIRFPRIPWPQA